MSSKAILKPIGTIFQQSVIFWKFLKKIIFGGNFSTKQTVVEIFQQGNFFKTVLEIYLVWNKNCVAIYPQIIFFKKSKMLWKFPQKAIFLWKFAMQTFFCGNFPTKQIIDETFLKRFFTGNLSTKQGFVEMFLQSNCL